MMENIGLLSLYFFICYCVVTWIGIIHTIFNIKVLHYKSMKESPGLGEGYEKTKPWHPLYNIVFFSLFGWIYMRGISEPNISSAIKAGSLWAVVCIVLDYIGWVLIPHPWKLTHKEFYIDYQPWISMIYLAIFMGPIIGYIGRLYWFI